jgi:CheY-like chemotaxis protein
MHNMTSSKTVLVVDDEPVVRALIKATLRKSSLRMLEAANGTDALQLAVQEQPDIVLLDVGLPGLDGYAVCRAIKSNPATTRIKVIMLTARAQKYDQAHGEAAGADAYITKPFSPQELLTSLLGSAEA